MKCFRIKPKVYTMIFLMTFWLALSMVGQVQASTDTETVKRDIAALKVQEPPKIDGILDDVSWKEAPQAINFIDGRTEKPAKSQSVVRIVYTEQAIYVAFHLYDDMPDKIVARQTKDQTQFQGEDLVSFSLDPFHTHQHADRNFFMVNALGTKFAHLATGRAEKSEWIGLWNAAAQVVDNGWIVEMEIPWQMLDYPESTEPINMGINFDRLQQRTGEHSWWCNLGVQIFKENDGHWVKVIPPHRKRDLKFLPYIMSGSNEGETNQRGYTARAGGDLRYEITQQLRIVGTANPDFQNIEQDVEDIDFSYGERFVGDRRPFFSEGGNVYNLGNRFYSRRIEDMDGGLNLFGKIGNNTSIGTLGTYHRNNQNFIIRASQSLTATSSVSTGFLSHHKRDTAPNNVGFISANARHGKLAMFTDLTQTWEGDSHGREGYVGARYNGSLVQSYSGVYWVDPDYVNHLGYQPFTGYRGGNFGSTLRNEWRDGFVRSVLVSLNTDAANTYDGEVFGRSVAVYSKLLTHSDYSVALRWSNSRFREFRDHLYSISFSARDSDRFNTFSIDYDWGEQADETIHYISANLKLRAYNFTLGLSSQVQWHFERQYQQILTVAYDFTPALSLGSRLIWRVEGTNVYFVLRRSGYAGTDFFIIFGDPNAPEFKRRLVAKVIRAF